jgi:hypothetical protein
MAPNVHDFFEATKDKFGSTFPKLRELKWEDVPKGVKEYMKAHPYLTSFQILMLLITCIPGLVAAPVLGAMGFSSLGPVAGKQSTVLSPDPTSTYADKEAGGSAAAFQSANGATAAFSALQSAAMGGYGVAIVNGVVQGVSVGAAGVAQLFSRFKRQS